MTNSTELKKRRFTIEPQRRRRVHLYLLATFFVAFFIYSGIESFADDDIEKLNANLTAAKQQLFDLEAPIFKNLSELGLYFDCLSMRDGQRYTAIESDLRSRLSAAGLKVVDDAGKRDLRRPYLNIHLQSPHPREMEISVEMTEQTYLKRNPKVCAVLPTWRRHENLVLPQNEEPEKQTADLLESIVDEFISQYRAANAGKRNK